MSESETNQPETSNLQDKPQAIVQRAVIKGSMLGGVLLVLFAIGAILIYLLTGVIGWDNTSIRIILAMCIGPLLGAVAFGVWILVQRGTTTNG